VQELLSHDNITTTQLYAAHRKNAKRELIRDMEWETEFEEFEERRLDGGDSKGEDGSK
jgi:hypothetical protein